MKKLIFIAVLLLLPLYVVGADKTVQVKASDGTVIKVLYHDNGDGTWSPANYASGSAALPAGTNNIGDVDVATLPATIAVKLTPTVTADAYTAKDSLGGELAINATVASGVIQAIVIADQDNETPSLDIFLFDTNPATDVADNAPLDIVDADLLNCIGVVQVRSTDYTAAADNAVGFKGNLGLPFKAVAGTTIYAYIQYNDTDAFTADSDIRILISILPN